MNLFSIAEISGKAQNAFKRFPVTLVWAIIGTFYCMFLLDDNSGDLFDRNLDVVLTLILGISWLIATQFFIEQQQKPQKWFVLKGVILVLLFLFCWYYPDGFPKSESPGFLLRFFLFLIAGHLFVLFAPFMRSWNKEAYWSYLKSVATAILRSTFFSGVLYLGLALALVAIDALFDTNINSRRFGQLFFFCLGIVNTWIYLSDFPKDVRSNTTIHFQKALEVFVKFILIPLVLLYLLILYAYSVKILIEWELPKGWVSYLVTVLAFLGFIVQVIINPVQKSIKAWTVNKFYPWFYILLLPLLVLLFIAIMRRVNDYGITENRYFVLVLAVWILAMALYLLFAKNKRLILLPISLFILALASSFGPWGAMGISKRSQLAQFEKVYTKIMGDDKTANTKQYNQLKSILNYLDDRQSLSQLDPITGIAMAAAFKDTINDDESYRYNYSWLDTQKVMDSLGIFLNPKDAAANNLNGKSYNYYGTHLFTYKSVAIDAYDYFSPIQMNSYAEKKGEIGNFLVSYDKENIAVLIESKTDSSEFYRVSLEEKLMALAKYNSSLPENRASEMVLDFEKERILGKLIFTDLGYNLKDDEITLNHSSAYLFLKQEPYARQN